MQREKVTLDLNKAVTLSLKFGTGKMMPDNGYGPSVLYSTSDDRALFVDLETSQRISDMRLQAGECITLCKTKNGKGPARINVWLSAATEKMRAAKGEPSEPAEGLRGPAPKIPARCYANPELEGQLEGSLANIAEGKAAAAPRPTPKPAAMAQRLDTHPPLKSTYGSAMQEFLLMAGRATREAERVLGAEGGSVRFDNRDVAALATTMFIQSAREGWIVYKPGEVA